MSFEKTNIFVNDSKEHKALKFRMPDGKQYTLAYSAIQKLKKGEYKALTLTEIVPDEQDTGFTEPQE